MHTCLALVVAASGAFRPWPYFCVKKDMMALKIVIGNTAKEAAASSLVWYNFPAVQRLKVCPVVFSTQCITNT